MQNYIVKNSFAPEPWFDPTANYNIRRNKTTGAFGGPPRRKDLMKRGMKYNKAIYSGIKPCELYKYDPNTFKKWKPGKDFNPIY